MVNTQGSTYWMDEHEDWWYIILTALSPHPIPIIILGHNWQKTGLALQGEGEKSQALHSNSSRGAEPRRLGGTHALQTHTDLPAFASRVQGKSVCPYPVCKRLQNQQVSKHW